MIRKAKAIEIKKELREKGIDTRNINVNVDPNTWSIWVKIKDLSIPRRKVSKILSHWEHYGTDDTTGEILQGGNIFVFVHHDYEALHKEIDEFRPMAREFMKYPFTKIIERDEYDINITDENIIFNTKPTNRWVRSLELNEQELARILVFDKYKNTDEVLGNY